MQENKRKIGIDIIEDVPWSTHFCQLYKTREDLIDILVPYFKAGLLNNEFCMWITSEPLNAQEAYEALKKELPDLQKYIDKKQIEILSHDQWYLRSGTFDTDQILNGWVEKLNIALAKGYEGLRLSGNTFWLERKNWKSFTDYEEAVNRVIGRYKILALCSYCIDKCNVTDIIDVMRNHEFALIREEGEWQLFENSTYKNLKNAFYSSKEKFIKLFLSMSEGVCIHEIIYDSSGKAADYMIIDVNPAYESITGLSKKDAVKKKASELYGTKEPPFLDIYARVTSTGEPFSFETYWQPMEKYFSISAFSLEKDKFATIFLDISERKKMENKLKYLASFPELNPMYVIEVDNSGNTKYINPAAVKRFPDLELAGKNHPLIMDLDKLLQSKKSLKKITWIMN